MAQLPPKAPADTLLSSVGEQLGATAWRTCQLVEGETASTLPYAAEQGGYVLVSDGNRLCGIVTSRDLLPLVAAGRDLSAATLGKVMTPNPVALAWAQGQDAFAALSLLQAHQIRHLPIVDAKGGIVGAVTLEALMQQLQLFDALTNRSVESALQADVACVPPSCSVREVAAQLEAQESHYIAITASNKASEGQPGPVGIATAQVPIDCQLLGLDPAVTPVGRLIEQMPAPLNRQDTLWTARERMRQQQVQQLPVTGDRGELCGVVTQTGLLSALDASTLQGIVSALQRQVANLEKQKQALQQQAHGSEPSNVSLRERERRFRTLFQQTSQLITLLAPDGTVLELNEAAQDTISRSRATAIGHPFWEAFNWEQSERLLQQLQAYFAIAVAGELVRNECEVTDATGQERVLDVSLRSVCDEGGQLEFVVVKGRDITERKRAEADLQALNQTLETRVAERTESLHQANAQLQRQNAVLQAQQEATIEGILLVDRDRNVSSYNQRFLDLWQIPQSIAQTRDDRRLLDYVRSQLVQPQAFIEWVEKLYQDSQTRNVEEIQLRDGRTLERYSQPVVSSQGEYYGRIWCFRDISDRKSIEAELRRSRQHLRNVLDSISAQVGVLDAEGYYLDVNAVTLAPAGLRREDVIGKRLDCTYGVSHSPQVQAQLREAIASCQRGEAIQKSLTVRIGESEFVTFDAYFTPIYNTSGQLEYIIASGVDVTARQQAEQQLRMQSQTLQAYSNSLQQLHRLHTTHYDSFEALINDYLQTGRKLLGLSAGIIGRADGNRCEIDTVSAEGMPLEPGTVLELDGLFCARVVRQCETLALHNAGADPDWSCHPMHRDLSIAAYLGTPIIVNGAVYGSLNFSDTSPRAQPFRDYERELIELMAQSLGRLIENRQAEQQRQQAEDRIKASLQEKETLLREIHHRVKNNLLVVSSLLDFQAEASNSPELHRTLADSQHRIDAMALIHEKLYRSQNLAQVELGEYLQTLAESLYEAYSLSPERVALHCQTEMVLTNIETAHPCGLLVNELLSNAFKHAFPPGRSGRIELQLSQDGNGQIALVVADNGVGLPPDLDIHQTDSLGMQLVGTFTEQLDASLSLERAGGTAFHLRFNELAYRRRF